MRNRVSDDFTSALVFEDKGVNFREDLVSVTDSEWAEILWEGGGGGVGRRAARATSQPTTFPPAHLYAHSVDDARRGDG